NHHHNHHHNGGKSKPKSSSHKAPLSPKVKAPPAPPKVKAPVAPPVGKAPAAPPENGSGGGPVTDSNAMYNVLDFGAKGDGSTDDTKAFEGAWAAACKVTGSKIIVPSPYKFLLGPITFSGPYCQRNIIFQDATCRNLPNRGFKIKAHFGCPNSQINRPKGLRTHHQFHIDHKLIKLVINIDGTIIAPSSFKPYGSGLFQWILFTKLVGLTIQGTGTVDGSGSIWWKESRFSDPLDDELKLIIPINGTTEKSPSSSAIRFYGSFDVTVTGITIQNSPQCHLKFDNCAGVSVYNFHVSSPGDSPNTDGIHLQNSKDVLIHTTDLSCGDDCVSIQTGCSNVYIHNVNCGPGHGISIGSLGKDNTKACVSNITVRDVMMRNTMNGVRIKTW
ncbi:hypothetical protein M8C21_011692, partial [Ambrosia artemisiifolia]